VVALCVLGVAGLIVTSILDNAGAAVTIGLCTAAAVLCLIVATAVGTPPAGPAPPAVVFDDDQAARVEAIVADLTAAGADETTVRALVREAVSLGKGASVQVAAQRTDEEAWQP